MNFSPSDISRASEASLPGREDTSRAYERPRSEDLIGPRVSDDLFEILNQKLSPEELRYLETQIEIIYGNGKAEGLRSVLGRGKVRA